MVPQPSKLEATNRNQAVEAIKNRTDENLDSNAHRIEPTLF